MTSNDADTKTSFWRRPMGTAIIVFAVILVLGFVFSSLGLNNDDEPAKADETTPATTSTSTQPTEEPAEPEDVTDWVKNVRPDKADHVISATRDSSGFLEIQTDLVDPRSSGPSPEGTSAFSICVAVADEGETRGAVLEADGTTFVTLRDGICTEQ